MRKSEITPELIELSKRAKELGFPQDVEEGDWYGYVTYADEPFVLGKNEMISAVETEETKLYLILSFSRCLAWLEKERYPKMLGMTLEFNNWIRGHWILSSGTKSYRGENIHEAIAKAVVKILEEPKEGRGER